MRTAHLAAATVVGILVGMIPSAAMASCAEFPPLDEHLEKAGVVFVGTIAGLEDDNRTALVDIEEVWRGGPLPARVTVHGATEPDDPTMMTSVDRMYVNAASYLFAVTVDERGRLRDDACTATREWSDDLDTVRPATVTRPEPTGDEAGGLPASVIGIAIVLLAIGAASVFAFRART